MTQKETLTPDYIFESSWEVCNKVGGIYTVLSTRAWTLNNIFGDNVIYIGPDLWKNKTAHDFEEDLSLLKDWREDVAEKEDLQVRIGRWNVPGKPIAVLVDFVPLYLQKEWLYYNMWEMYAIDSQPAYGDYDEACMFAFAAGKTIESLYRHLNLKNKKVVAHLNEWMLSMAALYLRLKLPEIGTVFTTHATSVGRSIAGNNKPLYDQFYNFNGDQMAHELNVFAKHTLEKKAAHYADCFTTVSEITAKECKQLLEKEPDVVTPNGFEDDFVPPEDDYKKKRTIARNILLKVAENLTGETIAPDSLLVATSGRYEYKNKGLDVFIEAISRVRLAKPERQIIAFILVPSGIDGPRADLLARMEDKSGAPFHTPLFNPFYTHNLSNLHEDNVYGYLHYLSFLNQPEYKCKLIFVPSYLTGHDGILNLHYYDVLVGLDLTVFPSYYEPWGYTPLESIAFGIPTITTNLAGFGIWAREAERLQHLSGVKVIKRTDHNYYEASEEIKNNIIDYSKLDKEEVSIIRRSTRELSEQASWEHFITYYFAAYDIAIRKAVQRTEYKQS